MQKLSRSLSEDNGRLASLNSAVSRTLTDILV
jgi:hypothetical protein